MMSRWVICEAYKAEDMLEDATFVIDVSFHTFKLFVSQSPGCVQGVIADAKLA